MPKSNLKSGRTWEKIVLALVCLCLIGAIIYTCATLLYTPEDGWGAENSHKTKSNFTLMTVQCGGALIPVSYTHLDVYKRQVFCGNQLGAASGHR